MKKLTSPQEYLGSLEKTAALGIGGNIGLKGAMGNLGVAFKDLGQFAQKHPWVTAGVAGAVALSELAPWVAEKVRGLQLAREHEKMVAKLRRSDEMLEGANSDELDSAYSSMAKFAPTLAADPNAARSFLRNAVASGGGVDFNTLKLLAETENQATGRFSKK